MDLENILRDLNSEQKQAVTYGDGPFLIIAGAGTGKTTVITRRIAWLILSEKAKPEEVMAVTFTDKAAGEMEERVDKLLPYGYVDLWISTFHSFCERILRQHALDIGLALNFKLLNQTQQTLLIRQNFDRFNLDYYKPLGNPFKFIQTLVKHFSRAKDEMVSPEEYLEYAEKIKLNQDSATSDELVTQEAGRLKEIAEAYHTYQQIMLENSALDFGDLISYTIKLFQDRPNILEKYRRQFKYILVDEFQDTNWAQYELLKLLAAPKNNLTVVADDDQSVYKFRGASYNNVIQFKKDFPLSQTVTLLRNYRSQQNILDLAYQFIQLNNPNRLEAQVCELGQLGGEKAIKICKKLNSEKGETGKVEYLEFKTQEEETKGVVDKIIELKDKNPDLSWNDFAILVRANDQAEIFCSALRWREIPYQFLASSGLFNKPIILDILAYLKLLDNYHESPALYRILTSPIFDPSVSELKNEHLVNLVHWANRKSQSLYQSLKQAASIANFPGGVISEIQKLLGWIDKHSQLACRQTVGKVVFAFLENTGYLKLISQKAEKGGENLENINLLNQFFKKIEEFEWANLDKSAKHFVQTMEMIVGAGDAGSLQIDFEEGPESVKVMTVHGAKGLEFAYVFVVNLVERRFPTIERKEGIELPDALTKEIIPQGDIHLQEERRLFYVAMTRAKEGLFLTSAEDYGGLRKKKPSPFLYELNLLKRTEGPSVKDSHRSPPIFHYLHLATPVTGSNKDKRSFILPSRFSFSQLRAFETCPLQYKFGFLLRIPCRGKASFSFGQSMHQTLYNFFHLAIEKRQKEQVQLFPKARGGVKNSQSEIILPDLDELLKIYNEAWIDDWYENKEQQEKYKTLGKKILKEFHQLAQKNPPRPEFLELDFNFKLGQFAFKGKMDRVDRLPDQGLEIIDYKTGRVKNEEMSLEDKEQLLIYQLAAENLFSDKVGKLTYYYLDNNSRVSFLGTEAELEKIKQKIIKTAEEIQQSDFPPKPGLMCKYCDFFGICDYRKI